jgi:shikimate kinase
MDTSNIILIGMPGAGKSTLGVLLAKSTGKPFLDTDLLIQQKENRLLQDIINQDGIEKFLDIEKEVIINIKVENHVIATGGSAVYRQSSMDHLKKGGIVVYLKLSYTEIEDRIKNIKSRGIAMSQSVNLSDLFEERAPLYEKYADITVDCSGKHFEETISEIIHEIKKAILPFKKTGLDPTL